MAYIAPIHRASSVRHAIKISFLGPDSDDLVVAKANRLEIYSPNPQDPQQLVLVHSKSLYGKVTLLEKLRPATSQSDHLFVGTDRYHYFTLSWDAKAQKLKTEKSYVDVGERAARDSQTGDRTHIDPSNRYLTIEMYEGVVNVLPIGNPAKGKRRKDNPPETGELGEPQPIRIPELLVKSSCFLHKRSPGSGLPAPEIALLHEDSRNRMRIKIRALKHEPRQGALENVELEDVKNVSGEVDLGSTFLIPLPPPIYGMVLVGDTSIAYIDEWNYRVTNRQPLENATVFVAWCQIDDDRIVLADDFGDLYLLFIQTNAEGEYAGHMIDVLGETSRASTLVYLDGGRIFVGSHQGDSQIIQIEEGGLSVVQTLVDNIAPILDFTIMDMGNRSSDAPVNEYSSGQARLVTGSGAFKDGSLRSVRAGVGLDVVGPITELDAPVSKIFSLRSSPAVSADDVLLVSFISHTRAWQFSTDGEAEELENLMDFAMAEPTLRACTLSSGRALQVRSSSVFLTNANGDMSDIWWPPGTTAITEASCQDNTLLLSLGGAALVVLDLSGQNIRQVAQRELGADEQVSCIALSKAMPQACVVGFWLDSRISVLSLADLTSFATEVADPDTRAVPRSLIVAQVLSDQPPALFVGLADGNVVTYAVKDPFKEPFASRKSIILGTQQASFAAIPIENGLENVFAICEHSSLIYGSEGRMVYSAVTAEDASCVCSFDSEFCPGAIAMATLPGTDGGAGWLQLAEADKARTTHVQKLPINQTVRRIAYSSDLKAFGLGCIQRTLSAGSEEVQSSFQLVDEIAFSHLHTFNLNQDELVEAVMRCKLNDGTGQLAERFVVGTAYLDDSNPVDARGRLLIFEVTEERQVKLVTEHSVRGSVRCLGMVEGRIVAALLKTVVVYAVEYETPSRPFLAKKAAFRTATAPIDMAITGSYIVVADLMKSATVLVYEEAEGGEPDQLFEVARHRETMWGTAVAVVADNVYLESDAEGNLVVLTHDHESEVEDDRRKLIVTSELLLGEMVNRIRPVTVQASPAAVVVPAAFLATVEGSIYIFALIADGMHDLLISLQELMAQDVESPGHIPFKKFRGYKSTVRDMGEEGPKRFVDGELVELLLDLPLAKQEEIAGMLSKEIKEDITVEGLKSLVESLRRVR